MADDIVGGLFGVNPDMYQQQQQQQVFNRAVALQNLNPFQQAAVGLQQAGYNFGGALGGAMGGVDPQLQRISTLNAISKQIDQSNPESMMRGAKMLAEAGFTQEALGLSQFARKASTEIAAASKSKAEVDKIQYGQAQDEKLRAALSELPEDATEEDVVRTVARFGSPDKMLGILTISKDKAAARQVALDVATTTAQGRLDVAKETAQNRLDVAIKEAIAKGEAAQTQAAAKVEAAQVAAAGQVEAAKKQAESRVEAAQIFYQGRIDTAIQRGEDAKVIAQMRVDASKDIADLAASTKSSVAQAQIDGRAAVAAAQNDAKAAIASSQNDTKAAIAAAQDSTKAAIAASQNETKLAVAKMAAELNAGNRALQAEYLRLRTDKLRADNQNKPMSTILQRDEIKDLEAIDGLDAQVSSLAPALKSLKTDPKTGKAPLELGPLNNLKYQAAAATGSSTAESRAYADLQRAVQSAVNIKTSAEKGVQTDNDVLRFANELTAAFGRNDTKTTLEALSNFAKAAETAKEKTLRKIEQRRASAGAEPFAPVGAAPAGAPATVVPTKRWNSQTNRLEEVK